MHTPGTLLVSPNIRKNVLTWPLAGTGSALFYAKVFRHIFVGEDLFCSFLLGLSLKSKDFVCTKFLLCHGF